MSKHEGLPKKNIEGSVKIVCDKCFGEHQTVMHERHMLWAAEEQDPICDYCAEPHKTSECTKNFSK